MSDHWVQLIEFNDCQLPDEDSSNRDHAICDNNNTARTISIQIESPSTLKQETEKDAKDEKTAEEKEEGQRTANSNNHMESFYLITQLHKMSQTMSMKSCTTQVNQQVESKDISKSSPNIMTDSLENN